MPIERPTLDQLRSRQEADLLAALGGSEFLQGSYLKAISDAVAAAANEIYGFIQDYQTPQGIPLTAEGQYLQDWGETVEFNRNAATFSTGTVRFTGSNGITIPVGTDLVASNFVTYRTTETVVIADGQADADVISLVAGSIGNLDADSELTLVTGLESVNSTVTVLTGGLIGGIDQESDTSLRSKILNFLRNRPQGGSPADYKLWVSEIAGTGTVWVFPLVSGENTVDVYFITDDEDDIIPGDDLVDQVQAYLSSDDRRPTTVTVYVRAPELVTQDFEISLTADEDENLDDVKLAVENNLKDLIRRERKPGGTLLLSKIREAVSTAAGEYNNAVVSPDDDVDFDVGDMPEFGEISWVE